MENYNHEKYDKFINNIINTRSQWNISEGEYWEGHHIIPRCMGGDGRTRFKDKNIIRLYPKEHFIAHKLLAEENSNNYSLVSAYTKMAFQKSDNQKRYELTAKEYAEAKKAYSLLRQNESQQIKDKRSRSYHMTWSTKSDEEKRLIWDKQQKSRDNRSDIDKQNSINKLKNSYYSKSEEEKREIYVKQQITYQSKTDEEKQHIRKKISEALNNRSESEKAETSRKLKLAIKNRAPEVEANRIKKQVEAWNKKSIEEKAAIKAKELATKAAKSDEEKAEIKNKTINACWYSKTKEEQQAIVAKREHSKKNRTEDQKAETARKHRETQIANGNGRAGGKPRKVLNITTGETFNYVKDAYTKYNLKFDTLRKCILKNVPDRYGNYWRYIDE